MNNTCTTSTVKAIPDSGLPADHPIQRWVKELQLYTDEHAKYAAALGIYGKLPSFFQKIENNPVKRGIVQNAFKGFKLVGRPENHTASTWVFSLLETARHVQGPRHKISACCRWPSRSGNQIRVSYSPERLRARWKHLQTCKRVHDCPRCSRIIYAGRQNDLQDMADRVIQRGWDISFLTLTIPHEMGMSLASVFDSKNKAISLLLAGRHWQTTKADFGIVGYVRSEECTLSKNGGWHPHSHFLIIHDRLMDSDHLRVVEARLKRFWARSAVKAGFGWPHKENGCKLVGGRQAHDYISSWGLPAEMAGGQYKSGPSSMHPFNLLEIIQKTRPNSDHLSESIYSACRTLFLEWSEARRGKRTITFSRGLRDLLKMNEDPTDEELADTVTDEEIDALIVAHADFKVIADKCQQGYILRLVEQSKGEGSEAKKYIRELRP